MKIAVGGSGGNSGGGTAKTFSGPPISFSGAGGTLEPVYVTDITIDLTGNTDTITDQCGYSEVRRSGTKGNWKVDCEGVVGDIQLSVLQTLAESDETVNVQTPVLGSRGGEYVIKKCSISHTDELNKIELPNLPDLDFAFKFKVSCESPQAAKSSA